MELITAEVLGDQIKAYLQHQLSLKELVDWAENAMMDGEFEETDDNMLCEITGRLGVADIEAFALSGEDFEQFLSQLDHGVQENGNMAIQNGLLKWDIPQLSEGLKIPQGDVNAYFTDGRRVSFLLERRIAYEILNGSLASSEGAGYDVLDSDGRKWEVRSVSRSGIYFCPSYMVGSGRHFEEDGFLQKLDEIAGYIVSDIESFPSVPYWQIPTDTVRAWWFQGQLGTASKISRAKALALLRSLS